MGILGGILSNLGGGAENQQHSAVGSALLEHIAGSSNGLSGLLQNFHNAGMSQQVNSWVGTGPNQAISPDQVQQGVGPDFISQIANRAGVSPTIAKVALAALLPAIVNHLTPQGRVEEGTGMQSMLSGLLRRSA